jgi:hypothetical protein
MIVMVTYDYLLLSLLICFTILCALVLTHSLVHISTSIPFSIVPHYSVLLPCSRLPTPLVIPFILTHHTYVMFISRVV